MSIGRKYLDQLLTARREARKAILEGRAMPNYTRPKINNAYIGKVGYLPPRFMTPPNWPFMERMVDRMVNDIHTQQRLLRMQLRADPDHELNKLVL